MAGNKIWILFFASETTSSFGLNNSNVILGKIEQRRESLLNIERTLHRTPNRDAVSSNRRGHNSLRLDIKMFLGSGAVRFFDDDIGVTPSVRWVATFDHIRLEDVITLQRRIHGKDGWKFLNFNFDFIQRFLEEFFIGMRNKSNGFREVLDFSMCQKRLFGIDQCDAVLPGYVFRQHNRELVPREFRVETDFFDGAVRHLRSYSTTVETAVEAHIIRVDCSAGYLRNAFFTQYTGPNRFKLLGHRWGNNNRISTVVRNTVTYFVGRREILMRKPRNHAADAVLEIC